MLLLLLLLLLCPTLQWQPLLLLPATPTSSRTSLPCCCCCWAVGGLAAPFPVPVSEELLKLFAIAQKLFQFTLLIGREHVMPEAAAVAATEATQGVRGAASNILLMPKAFLSRASHGPAEHPAPGEFKAAEPHNLCVAHALLVVLCVLHHLTCS